MGEGKLASFLLPEEGILSFLVPWLIGNLGMCGQKDDVETRLPREPESAGKGMGLKGILSGNAFVVNG